MYIFSDYLKIILELASYLMVKLNGTSKDICRLSCLLTNKISQGTKAYTNWKRRSKILFIHRQPERLFSKSNGISKELELTNDLARLHNINIQKSIVYLYSSNKHAVQFSSVAQSCPTLCHPMNHTTPGLLVHHQLPEFTQTHVRRVGDAIQLSHPLSSPSCAPNPSQHQSLFQ